MDEKEGYVVVIKYHKISDHKTCAKSGGGLGAGGYKEMSSILADH